METGRNINVAILGRSFQVKASSEESERRIRAAAEYINKAVEKYASTQSGGKNAEEMEKQYLIFTALNVCLKNLEFSDELKRLQSEAERVENEMAAYIENID